MRIVYRNKSEILIVNRFIAGNQQSMGDLVQDGGLEPHIAVDVIDQGMMGVSAAVAIPRATIIDQAIVIGRFHYVPLMEPHVSPAVQNDQQSRPNFVVDYYCPH